MTQRPSTPIRRPRILMAAALALLGATFLFWQGFVLGGKKEKAMAMKFPEELVYVRSKDDVPNGGALFNPPKTSAKTIAVLWIHGWGVNFYQPSYVKIGRALAERGYPCITANTRMHDIGFNIGERNGKRFRGGGYWGIASEQVQDITAWIDFAEGRGFKKVVLVGHSAGWAAVRQYQSEAQDPRVVGVVLASGGVKPGDQKPDSGTQKPAPDPLLAEAKRLIAEGKGDDLMRIPNRASPSFISADTFLDNASTPPELGDFFGVQTPNPAVTRVHSPLLAFFGTNGDVGTQADLDLIKSGIQRQPSGPSRVETVMIKNADHMYTGEEAQVADVIARWADTLTT